MYMLCNPDSSLRAQVRVVASHSGLQVSFLVLTGGRLSCSHLHLFTREAAIVGKLSVCETTIEELVLSLSEFTV